MVPRPRATLPVDLQHEVQHALRHLFHGSLVAQSPADLIEQREQTIFALQIFKLATGVDSRLRPFGKRARFTPLQKFRNAFPVEDLREVRSQLRRSLRDHGSARHVFELQLDLAEADNVAALQLGALDAYAI